MWHACACVRACVPICSCDLSRHERERVLFTLRRLFRLSLRLQDFRKDRYFVNEFCCLYIRAQRVVFHIYAERQQIPFFPADLKAIFLLDRNIEKNITFLIAIFSTHLFVISS